MIWRAMATLGATAPVAVEALGTNKGAMVAQPVIWSLVGYPFEAGGMIAALFGCAVARAWHGSAQAARREYRWVLDAPITAMTFGAAVAIVIALRPEPWNGLLYGAGLGVIGEGLFKVAERVLRATGAFTEPDTPD